MNSDRLFHNMKAKVQDKQKAIQLRKRGKSYREIQKEVSVSKGTLSNWLKDLELNKKEGKYLEERSKILQDNGRLKVALQNRKRNEERRDVVRRSAREKFFDHANDPFFVLGLSLYWAEGAKKNDYYSFSSSDPEMLKIMMVWTDKYLGIQPHDCSYRLYIHKPYANENCERYWSRECRIPMSQFQQTIYKSVPQSTKKNEDYKGSLRMVVFGVNYLTTIKTWQNLLCEYYVGSR